MARRLDVLEPRTRSPVAGTSLRTDRTARASKSEVATSESMRGLNNARTRIVGDRTGVLADAIISLVRFSRATRGVLATVFARVATVVTVLGWVFIAIVPVTLVVGYALGWRELIVVGFAAAILVIIAVLYLIGRNTIAVELQLEHDRVVVGDRAAATVTASNTAHRRTLGVTIEIPVGADLAEAAIPSLRSDSIFTHELDVTTVRRGVVIVGPVRTVRADPVGLIRRELVWSGTHELFVHPKTIGIRSMSTGFIRDLEGSPTRDLSSDDVSFHALREYAPGDELRNIHWKSTARTGTYMVRQFEETRRSHLLIALSLARSDYSSEEEFELAVSVAGSLGIRAIRDTRTVTVAVSERTEQFAKRKVFAVRSLSTISRSRLLDDLARVEQAESALTITDVARVTGDNASGVSVAFLICGSGATSAQLRSASTKYPIGVDVIAVVCDPESAPGLRRVGGLSVLTVGFLDDLMQSLARTTAA